LSSTAHRNREPSLHGLQQLPVMARVSGGFTGQGDHARLPNTPEVAVCPVELSNVALKMTPRMH